MRAQQVGAVVGQKLGGVFGSFFAGLLAGLFFGLRSGLLLGGARLRGAGAGGAGEQLQRAQGLHRLLLEKLRENQPLFLPERLFIFGIPALPKAYFS